MLRSLKSMAAFLSNQVLPVRILDVHVSLMMANIQYMCMWSCLYCKADEYFD